MSTRDSYQAGFKDGLKARWTVSGPEKQAGVKPKFKPLVRTPTHSPGQNPPSLARYRRAARKPEFEKDADLVEMFNDPNRLWSRYHAGH